MHSGIAYFATADGVPPGDLARLVEERGHRWLFFAEHTHIPASRETPWGGREGAPPLPAKYHKTYDLFVAMAAALAATSTLRVGSGICLVTQRDPIIAANEVASLDHLSGGRVEFGVGAGWNREELRNHGTDPRTRMRLMRERILAMKEIWAHHEATFHGDFVSFDRIWCEPKPVQRPHPPILVGGDGPTVFARVAEYGDAWLPNARPGVIERIPELRDRAGADVPVHVMGIAPDAEKLEPYAAAGVERALFWLPSAGRAAIEQTLDDIERAMAELNGT
jgi:probable F420-dependent oxidoreductase